MHSYVRYNRGLAKQYDQWMVAMHYAKTTQGTYRRVLQRFIEFIGSRSVANVTHLDIRRFVGQISEEGATLNTAYQNLGVLRLFYDFLNLGGVVSYVAPRFVRLRPPVRSTRPALTEGQIQKILSATRTLRERALVEFLYGTGCRVGEARHLRIENLDFNSKSARIRGKFGKARTVLLTGESVDALRAYIAARKRGFVFQYDLPNTGCLYVRNGHWLSRTRNYIGPNRFKCRTIGRVDLVPYEAAKNRHDNFLNHRNANRPARNSPLTKWCLQNIIKSIARRTGIKGVTSHAFRHSFATHLYNHGATLEIVGALLGHVWIDTTMKYAHVSPDRVVNAFQQCHPRPKLTRPQSVQLQLGGNYEEVSVGSR